MLYRLLVIQLVGFFGWIIMISSYYRKEVNQVLLFHMIATMLFSIHYYLLGAYSGLFICLVEVVRDFLYYKTDKDNYIFAISLALCSISGLICIKNVVDYLPIIASLIDGYTLSKKKKVVVIGAIVSYSMWIVYNFFVGSIAGIFTDGVIVISNLIILVFKVNIFDEISNK